MANIPSREPLDPSVLIIVDRSLPEVQWKLRREASDVPEIGRGFGKWLADPAGGRFLIIDNSASGIGNMLISIDDEAGLIEHVCRFVIEQLKAGTKVRDIEYAYTASDIRGKLERLIGEINSLLAAPER